MSNQSAEFDANNVPTLTAITDDSNQYITKLLVDPATGRLLVSATGGGSSGITIGTTTITSGTNTYIEYNNSGVVGEYSITGTGTVVAMQTSPALLGTPTVPTLNAFDNSTKIANSSFTQSAIQLSMATLPLNLGAGAGGTYSFNTLGSGCVITFTATAGTITSINLIPVAGSGYAVGDLLSIPLTNYDAILRVASLTGSGVASLQILYGGTGYTSTGSAPSGAASSVWYTFTLTGTLTSNATFLMTNGTYLTQSNQWVVNNNTTGGYSTTFKISNGSNVGIGTGVVIPQGTNSSAATFIQTDGETDVWIAMSNPANMLTGTVAPVNGGTGVANNNASTITISGNYGTTLTVTNTTSVTLPTSGTLVNSAVASLSSLTTTGTITSGGLGTGATLGSVTVNIASSAVGDIWYAGASNVMTRLADVAAGQPLLSGGVTTAPAYAGYTFSATASQTYTFPGATATLAGLGTSQTFTGQDKFNNFIDVNNAITASGNAATVPVTYRLNTVTNNSAATLTITMTTASAVDGQMTIVRILDATAVAQTISWVNTENSNVNVPPTSNGSTTLFLTVGFIYNGGTSKWRCIGWN